MKDEELKPKIGSGHAAAMFRQGLSELRAVFYNESNVAQPAQYGLYGTRTPGEVAEARRSEGAELEEEPRSVLGERLKQAEREGEGHEHDPREPERG